jgi:glycosyltransferase involved in cell wall biosynthesis
MMYWMKDRFDCSVARDLEDGPAADAVVAMYGSALRTFASVKRHHTATVLNYVSSHPAYHNRYLLELAGVDRNHHEILPPAIADRIVREAEAADVILVPSRFVANQLISTGTPPERIRVEPYGVDLRAFRPEVRGPRVVDDPLVCLYVGQISHRKGLRDLLEVARRSKSLPIEFRLIGPMVSREVLRDAPNNVKYEGSAFPGGIPEAMRKADMFILPTLEDACALVVMEAMASGLPVITTNQNGSAEQLTNGSDAFVVAAGDVAALTESVVQLATDDELRLRMGARARAQVEESRSWDQYACRVLAICEEAIRP